MDDSTDVTPVLGTWKEWARNIKSELNRLSVEIKELRDALTDRVGELYARIDNRHDAVHALLVELESRVRSEIAVLQLRVSNGVDRDTISRIQDKVDEAADKELVNRHTDEIKELDRDVVALKTQCQIWGALAGVAGALIVAVVEWFLNKH